MIAYGIGFLPLIRELREAHPRFIQPCYAYDAGVGGKFGHILEYFQDLQERGSPWGYLLEPTESILAVATRNVARAEEFFCGMGIKIVTVSRYLGGFVGYRAAEDSWLAEKVQGWTEAVKNLPGVARNHPHTAYAGLQKSI